MPRKACPSAYRPWPTKSASAPRCWTRSTAKSRPMSWPPSVCGATMRHRQHAVRIVASGSMLKICQSSASVGNSPASARAVNYLSDACLSDRWLAGRLCDHLYITGNRTAAYRARRFTAWRVATWSSPTTTSANDLALIATKSRHSHFSGVCKCGDLLCANREATPWTMRPARCGTLKTISPTCWPNSNTCPTHMASRCWPISSPSPEPKPRHRRINVHQKDAISLALVRYRHSPVLGALCLPPDPSAQVRQLDFSRPIADQQPFVRVA